MTKAHHRHHPHSPAPTHPVSAPIWDRIPHKAIILSFVLAAIPFAMGKYFEFNTAGAFDSGAYMYSARRVLDGAVPWVNEGVTAKAGTLLVNMLGISLFGYVDHAAKMIQMFMQVAALVTVFFVMRRIFGTLAAGVSLVVASFYLSAPVIAKYGNVKEQYMIACMMLGISMVLMRQMGGRWWWGLLAGGFLAWGPMFKETGYSAIFATFIFILLQPLLKNRSWKLAGTDVALILLGGIIAIVPVHIWIVRIGSPTAFNPYVLISQIVFREAKAVLVHPVKSPAAATVAQDSNKVAAQPEKAPSGGYLGHITGWDWKEQVPVVLRHYLVVILPIALAFGACIVRLVRSILRAFKKIPADGLEPYEKLVLLLGLWWALDMAFVWISPRSWEEYYLPLCASGAMTGGYLIALYRDRLRAATSKAGWVWLGIIVPVCMVAMGWQVFFGLHTSPFAGTKYQSPSRGYVQKFDEIKEHAAWEELAHYIRDNSSPSDTIYVWGWFPGIYVESQRMSASGDLPFTSEAHVVTPETMARQMKGLVASFEEKKPRYLVDSRKRDFPWNRPALEFWPFVMDRTFLPNDARVVGAYETQWYNLLKEEFDIAEAERFKAMKPLRDYVMANYHIVAPETYRPLKSIDLTAGQFGVHVLLERNNAR